MEILVLASILLLDTSLAGPRLSINVRRFTGSSPPSTEVATWQIIRRIFDGTFPVISQSSAYIGATENNKDKTTNSAALYMDFPLCVFSAPAHTGAGPCTRHTRNVRFPPIRRESGSDPSSARYFDCYIQRAARHTGVPCDTCTWIMVSRRYETVKSVKLNG